MPTGSCLCGAVHFEVAGALPQPSVCHCSQCRRQSGHAWSSTDVPQTDVTIRGTDAVRWFRSSSGAQRGFCATCGSFLFWQADGAEVISIAMGAMEGPTGTSLACHIYVADKGDYYEIADGLPQHPGPRR